MSSNISLVLRDTWLRLAAMVGSLVVSGDWEVGLRRKAWRARSNEGRVGGLFPCGNGDWQRARNRRVGKGCRIRKSWRGWRKAAGLRGLRPGYGRYWRVCSMSLVVGA